MTGDAEEPGAESRARMLRVARLTGIHCNLSTASLLTRPNCSEVFFPGAVVVRATTRDIRARLTQHSPRGGSLSQGYVHGGRAFCAATFGLQLDTAY